MARGLWFACSLSFVAMDSSAMEAALSMTPGEHRSNHEFRPLSETEASTIHLMAEMGATETTNRTAHK
jgi:hypothetical protein